MLLEVRRYDTEKGRTSSSGCRKKAQSCTASRQRPALAKRVRNRAEPAKAEAVESSPRRTGPRFAASVPVDRWIGRHRARRGFAGARGRVVAVSLNDASDPPRFTTWQNSLLGAPTTSSISFSRRLLQECPHHCEKKSMRSASSGGENVNTPSENSGEKFHSENCAQNCG